MKIDMEKRKVTMVILFLHNHTDFKNFRFAIADAILTSELRTSQQLIKKQNKKEK